MNHHEQERIRQLWAAVVHAALHDHARAIDAARRDKTATKRVRQRRIDAEIAAARRYIESADFRTVCEMAEMSWRPVPILAAVVTQPEAFRRYYHRAAWSPATQPGDGSPVSAGTLGKVAGPEAKNGGLRA